MFLVPLRLSFVTTNDKTEINLTCDFFTAEFRIQWVAFYLSLINISVLNIADKQTMSQAQVLVNRSKNNITEARKSTQCILIFYNDNDHRERVLC